MPNGVVIVVANQKGGVGKTTCAYALAECKAKEGKKTLMIDMDSQCSLTSRLGLAPYSSELDGKSSCDLYKRNINIFDRCFPVIIKKPEMYVQEYLKLAGETTPKNKKSFEGIIENLFILPSSPDLSYYGTIYEANINILKENINKLAVFFDYIFIDCGPELGNLLVGPLVCANKVVMPVIPEVTSYDGLANIDKSIMAVKYPEKNKIGNPDLEVAGVIINKYMKTLTHHRAYLAKAEQEQRTILGIVPQTTKVLHAMDSRVPVTIAYPRAEISKVYQDIAKKL